MTEKVEKIAIELGPIQETLLIPLLGRAVETRKGRGLIHDEKAIEIVSELDYDFTKWEGGPSMAGASLRTRMYDEQVQLFLDRHPHGTVVEIGAGLNTRYERLDNGTATWIEMDLPDSMALRRQFFEDTERRRMVTGSVLESAWFEAIRNCPEPYFFVSEAVIIYLENHLAEKALRQLAENFPGSELLMDTTSSEMVDSQAKHDAMKHMSRDSWFRWRCEDPGLLENWGLRLEETSTFADISKNLRKVIPPVYRFMLTFFPWVIRRKVSGYKINRFTLVPPKTAE